MQNNGDWSQSPTWPPPDAGYYPIPPRTSSQSRSTSNTSSHNPYSSFQNPYAESSRQPQYDPYQDPWVSAQDAYLSQQVPQALGFQFKNPVLTDPKPLSGTSPAPQPLLQPAPGFERLPAPPSFLVINLFTLRLAFKLIQGLDYYAERVEDLNWIAKFLEIYHPGYDLAKLTGERWRRYLAKYPDIVRRMKRQKSYPKIFMALHPGTPECREVIRKRGGMTDNDRIEIANFVEAAHEWGSTVLVPKSEFERMKVLTSGRLVADDKREATDLDPRRAPPREPDPSLKEIVNNPGLYHV